MPMLVRLTANAIRAGRLFGWSSKHLDGDGKEGVRGHGSDRHPWGGNIRPILMIGGSAVVDALLIRMGPAGFTAGYFCFQRAVVISLLMSQGAASSTIPADLWTLRCGAGGNTPLIS